MQIFLVVLLDRADARRVPFAGHRVSAWFRLDRVRSVPWQLSAVSISRGDRARSPLAARDGSLWICTDEGLATWKDGRLTQHPS